MTDKTDIAALREAMLNKGKSSLTAVEVVTIISEIDRLNDTVKHLRIEVSASDAAFLEMKKQYSTQFDRCRELSTQLEAERQRVAEITEQYVDRTTALSFATQRAEAVEKEVTYWCNLNARRNEEVAELRAKLANPVVLPNLYLNHEGLARNSGDAVRNKTIQICGDKIRAAGFTVKGE